MKISSIVADSEKLNARAFIDEDTVVEYAQLMRENLFTPTPLIVIKGGDGRFYLIDGYHRLEAYKRLGIDDVPVQVTETDLMGEALDDFLLRAVLQANTKHGRTRTNADKRRALELALRRWPHISDSELAKLCGISRPTVAKYRRELGLKQDKIVVHRGNQVYTMQTPQPLPGDAPDYIHALVADGVIGHKAAVKLYKALKQAPRPEIMALYIKNQVQNSGVIEIFNETLLSGDSELIETALAVLKTGFLEDLEGNATKLSSCDKTAAKSYFNAFLRERRLRQIAHIRQSLIKPPRDMGAAGVMSIDCVTAQTDTNGVSVIFVLPENAPRSIAALGDKLTALASDGRKIALILSTEIPDTLTGWSIFTRYI